MRCELRSPLFPHSLWRSLASCLAALPLASLPLILHPWTVLGWSHLLSLSSVCDRFVVVPRQLVGLGWCSPASPNCPPSRVRRQHSFGFSASLSPRVFAMRSPCRVESVSVLDRNEGSYYTFLVFGRSLRDEVTLTGQVFLRSRSERRLRASSLGFGAKPARWGHPYRVVLRISAHSIRTKASSIHLSFVASRWGHPMGQAWFSSHSIETKSSLDSWSVFLQDGVTLFGSDSNDLISIEGITTVGLLEAFFRPVLGVSFCHLESSGQL